MLIKNKNIIKRQIHDTYFLIDITQNYLENTCSLYEINEIGAFIWDELDTSHTVIEIAQKLCDAIIDPIALEDLLEDVEDYINILKKEKFVVESHGRNE